VTAVELSPSSPLTIRRFELRLLGGFELRVDGRPVHLQDVSQKVLAFLSLQTAPVRRNFVAGSLWCDKGDDRASANLRTAIWRMPPEVAGFIRSTRTTLDLEPSADVDYRNAIKVTHGVIHEHLEPTDRTMAQMLHGQLLPDWYDDWVVTERERLSQMRLHALEVVARISLGRGQWDDAIALAHAIVRSEPLRETGHLLLIRAFLATGNRSDALRQVQRLDALLRAELGIAASAEAWRLADLARAD
jgi:DNA-binding SARP family transcriptional activator